MTMFLPEPIEELVQESVLALHHLIWGPDLDNPTSLHYSYPITKC